MTLPFPVSFMKSVQTPPPSNSVAPVISSNTGFTEVNAVLSTTDGTWTGSPTFTYQWYKNSVVIVGATAATYTLITGDAGGSITCRVTATNAGGNTTASSNALSPVLTRRMLPTDFANLQVWYDPNDPGGLVQVAGEVSQLTDLSANARNMAPGPNQPAVLATGLNGTIALAFTGIEYLLWTGTSIPYSGGWTGAAIVMPDYTAMVSNARGITCAGPTNGDTVAANYSIAVRNVSSNGIGSGVVNGAPLSNHAIPDDTWGVICSKRNASTVVSRYNGADEQTIGGGTGTTGIGRIAYGVALASSGGLGATSWKGRLASSALYTGNMTQADMQKLEAILAWRASSASLLDAGHPYKTDPPRM